MLQLQTELDPERGFDFRRIISTGRVTERAGQWQLENRSNFGCSGLDQGSIDWRPEPAMSRSFGDIRQQCEWRSTEQFKRKLEFATKLAQSSA